MNIPQKLEENWSSPGPKGKFTIGNRAAYPVDVLIEWMQERAAQ